MTPLAKIDLITDVTSEKSDDYGSPIRTETHTSVYAAVNAVKRSEFYQGQAAGLKPEITFECYAFEYSGQKIVEYNGKRYSVIRAYPVKGERIELICSDIVRAKKEETEYGA